MKNSSYIIDYKVTISKAIGIILMVACHGGIPNHLFHFIYMFHMPLFFFMSGYCLKEKYILSSPPFTEYIKKKIKGLYIPYVKWSLLFLLAHNIFYKLNVYNDIYGATHYYTWEEIVKKAIHIIIGLHGTEQLLGGYWFLPQLFYASIIGFFIIKYTQNLYWGCLSTLLIAIITSVFNFHIPFWGIGSLSFLSTSFFIAGFVYKKLFDNWDKTFLTILFAIVVAVGSIYCYTNMLQYTANKIIPYFICAVCGTIMVLNISKYIAFCESRIKRLLVYIGNNTLTILTWHFLCFKMTSLIIIEYHNLPIEKLACFPIIPQYAIFWPLYSIIGLGVPLTIKYFFNKHN